MSKKNTSMAQTDWNPNAEISPEIFANSVLQKELQPVRKTKSRLTLRVDDDVLTWFKSQGKGYQTRINSLLKAYKEAYQKA